MGDVPLRIQAPWMPGMVTVLNAQQRAGLTHPYTCPSKAHAMRPTLEATVDGWVCPEPGCDFVQDWTFADPRHVPPLLRSRRSVSGRVVEANARLRPVRTTGELLARQKDRHERYVTYLHCRIHGLISTNRAQKRRITRLEGAVAALTTEREQLVEALRGTVAMLGPGKETA